MKVTNLASVLKDVFVVRVIFDNGTTRTESLDAAATTNKVYSYFTSRKIRRGERCVVFVRSESRDHGFKVVTAIEDSSANGDGSAVKFIVDVVDFNVWEFNNKRVTEARSLLNDINATLERKLADAAVSEAISKLDVDEQRAFLERIERINDHVILGGSAMLGQEPQS